MQLENTYGNNTHDLRNHYKLIKKEFGNIPKLGLKRFQLLRCCFNPTISQLIILSEMIGESSQKYIIIIIFFSHLLV